MPARLSSKVRDLSTWIVDLVFPRLTGHHCLVVDDVWTTGAAVGDAARALRAAGVWSVTGFVLAQTPPAALKALVLRDSRAP